MKKILNWVVQKVWDMKSDGAILAAKRDCEDWLRILSKPPIHEDEVLDNLRKNCQERWGTLIQPQLEKRKLL